MNHRNTILVIEDHDDIRESTAEILELAGYEVLTAPDGKAGFDMALKHRPDLILCDIMMPALDGFGVLYLLGKHAETAHIPLIFLTAKTERADVRKGMEMGADDYITKPFDDMELLRAIESRLKKREGLRQSNRGQALNISETDQNLLMEELLDLGRIKNYKRKHTIYQEGDVPNYVFQVRSGKVRSYLFDKDGRALTTEIYVDGDLFGYEALFMHEAYQEYTETLEACEICLVEKEDFYTVLQRHPSLNQRFIRFLTDHMRNKDKKLLGFAYHSVRKRIASALVVFAEKFREHPQSDSCSIDVSREDLASLAGTASETVSRNLADFKEEGLITKTGNTIEVHSIEKLKRIKQ